jgi:protein TonB
VGKGEVIIPPEEELEPPPFRPVQIEPRVVLSVTPDYPRLAVETGLEGKVWVKIWLDHSGKPRKAVILKGDAEVLNEAALAAAMKFIFTPAIMNDRPVSVWVAIPFSFKLH